MKYILTVLCLTVGLSSPSLFAAENPGVSAADRASVNAALEKLSKTTGTKFTATDIKATPIPGLFQVTSDLSIFYVTKDGKYLVSGDLIDLHKDKKNWSLTEKAMRNLRVKALAQLGENKMIVFPAQGKRIGVVTVFTDIDCPFCRKMQEHIKDYNDAGIEIRYVAFPRTGPNTPSFEKAITVWCSSDKPRDLTLAKQGKDLPKNLCKDSPVAEEFELGRRLGVSGTPTLIFENGAKVGGMMEPKEMAKFIKEEVK